MPDLTPGKVLFYPVFITNRATARRGTGVVWGPPFRTGDADGAACANKETKLMTESNELRERIRSEQDKSWEGGYSCGQFGIRDEPTADVSWPSHWRMGYRAAKADLTSKQGVKS